MRYVDEICIICNSREEATAIHSHLNTIHDNIKFELELPNSENHFSLCVNSNGNLDHWWYVKPANNGIKLHGTSHLPRVIKDNMVRNEFIVNYIQFKSQVHFQKGMNNRSNHLGQQQHHVDVKSVKNHPKIPVRSVASLFAPPIK
jgi:hypothetical protein